ncbi:MULTISPECIES: lasso peptide biosynthesis PqqD family chaperone [Streptomyces]|uniref:Lasso peptide biosynthesis PqqD family chaperone n=3 Tax=Streptomyces TaxID=1883 RepID=A0A3S9PBX5_STRLT|nr:lasso peptide biosynthesis PqqD family chaperone [Streptomyces luteoverticillatus]AZQ69863.1 lasso peptide biosynthesis PqqD family chaperone [Streptomyces luteoverticillatus]
MPSLRQDISAATVEDGMVLLDERSGRYYQLNGSGALVLRILIEGGGEKEAADALTEHYDVPRDRALADIGRIVRRLCGAGLMTP